MMREMKYIIVERPNGLETPFVFSNTESHAEIAGLIPGTVVAAGFVQGDVTCYGHSVSLGVVSRKQDAEILNRALGKES